MNARIESNTTNEAGKSRRRCVLPIIIICVLENYILVTLRGATKCRAGNSEKKLRSGCDQVAAAGIREYICECAFSRESRFYVVQKKE